MTINKSRKPGSFLHGEKDMTIYKQYDSRWKKKYYRATSAGTSTMGGTGCGPSACANVHQLTDPKVTPWTAAQWLMKHGYATNGSGTIHGGIKNYFLAMGLTCAWLTERAGNQYGMISMEYAPKFKTAIRQGHWGVLLMGASVWTSAGHYIAVTGFREEKGEEQYYVCDSGAKNRDGWWPWEAFERYVKHFYVITNPDAGKKAYSGTFPEKFPLRGYYKNGDGWKTCVSGTYILQIKNIQAFMNWAVKAGLTVDGQYGEKTVAAVKCFQKAAGLTQDGFFGKKTLAAAKIFKR